MRLVQINLEEICNDPHAPLDPSHHLSTGSYVFVTGKKGGGGICAQTRLLLSLCITSNFLCKKYMEASEKDFKYITYQAASHRYMLFSSSPGRQKSSLTIQGLALLTVWSYFLVE